MKYLRSNLSKVAGYILAGSISLIIIITLVVYYLPSEISPSTTLLFRAPQEVLIESKGLQEFSPENDTINTVSSEDKKLAGEIINALQLVGDGKDKTKIQQSIDAIGRIIDKHPDYSDGYVQKSLDSIILGNADYQKIMQDLNYAIQYHKTGRGSEVTNTFSIAQIYALKAKVDFLVGNYQQAMKDLGIAINTDVTKISDVFNTGGVKPEDNSNPTAIQKKDLDLLIAKYPNDYRSYMFRGLFYEAFTPYNLQTYSPALDDLTKALNVNHNSALVNYFLGTVSQKMSFWTKEAASDISDITGKSGGYKDRTREIALNYFKEAVKLDQKFTDAYGQAAEELSELKRSSEAIPYYDKVIELDPAHAGAYNDRGLAKTSINDHYGAIEDFSQSIDLKKTKADSFLDSSYENRASVYIKVANYDSAIEDYSRAIGLKFAQQVILMSIPQIRSIYPELSGISDQDLVEGLRQKYFSDISSADFIDNYKHDTMNKSQEKKSFEDFVLAGLYVNRADAYFAKGNLRKATKDYNRALKDDSTYILDRWKPIKALSLINSNSEYSIDIQTLDSSKGNIVSLWLKILNIKSQANSEENYQIDCSARKLKSLSRINYNADGSPVNTLPEKEWESVIPETIGEILYNDVCLLH